MNEHLKYIGKLTASAVFSFIKINLLGLVSTILVLVIGIFPILGSYPSGGGGGHAGGVSYLLVLWTANPVGTTLYALLLTCSTILYFVLGNQYILKKYAHRVLKEKAEKHIEPTIDKVVTKLQDRFPDLLKSETKKAEIQKRLIQITKTESDNWLVKKLVRFGLRKTKLEDVNFSDPNLSLVDVAKGKIMDSLKEMTSPSRNAIWILLATQWVFLIAIVYFSKQ